MKLFKPLTYATLSWKNNAPYSTQFSDIYFNPEQGIAETEYVFLQGNQLIESWQNSHHRNTPWLIGETGFGTGLNFFVIADAFLNYASPQQQLHYISTEQHPIAPDTLKKIVTAWPQFAHITEDLCSQYPPPIEGYYRLHFCNRRIQLTLLLGDATEQLNTLLQHPKSLDEPITMDAWILDGFSPAKNPQLWNKDLFSVITRLSKPGTRCATFTAARIVKEGLLAAGFQIKKRKGFGKKRDCLAGEFTGLTEKNNPHQSSLHKLSDTPWFINKHSHPKNKTVAIIGGGLAGTACAYSLAQRGWQVHLYEKESDLAQITSGNPAGVLSINLGIHNNAHNRFYQSSYYYAVNQLKKCLPKKNAALDWNWCGVLQCTLNQKELEIQKTLIRQGWTEDWLRLVSAEQASELSGITCQTGGLFFPNAGWIRPYALCHQRCQHPNIHVHLEHSIEHLIFNHDSWQLLNKKNECLISTSAVIIANAFDALKFTQTQHLPLRPMRGQVSFLPSTPASRQLKTVLSYEGYTTPTHNNWHSVGATFSPNDADLRIREKDNDDNMNLLRSMFPEFHQSLKSDALSNSMTQARVGIRCQTPDYLPITGPVPKQDFFISHYDALRTGHAYQALPAGEYWPNLYVSLGHGSRGLTTTDFCAEIIASQLNKEFFPIDTAVIHAVHPARFLIRDLRRKII